MKKTMRTVIASILLFVMLFAISATTISALPSASGGNVESGDIGTLDPIGGGTGTSSGIDLGWCSVEVVSDANGNKVNVLWYHNLDAAFQSTPEQLKMLVDAIVDGAKQILYESIKSGEGEVDGALKDFLEGAVIDSDSIIDLLLTAFLEKKYGEATEHTTTELVKALFGGNDILASETLMVEFAEYSCEILELAIKLEIITLDELKGIVADGEALSAKIVEIINQEIDTRLETEIDKEVTDRVEKEIKKRLDEKLEEEGIADSISPEDYERRYNELYTQQGDQVRNEIYTPAKKQEIRDIAIERFFEVDSALVFDNNIALFSQTFASEYDATVAAIEANPDETVGIKELISRVEELKVDGASVLKISNGTVSVDKAAIIAALKKLPKPSALAKMANDDMKWAWDFDIVADLATVSFSLNIEVAAGHTGVREMAAAISKLVSVTRNEQGTILVDVNLFDSFNDAILSVLTAPSTEVPDSLKRKLFELSGSDFTAVHKFITKEFTYSNYLSIINAINYEAILDDLAITGINNERIKALLSNKTLYEKLVQLVDKLYEKSPASFKDGTLFSFYKGEGEFSYGNEGPIDIAPILSKLGKYGEAIASYLGDNTVFDIQVRGTVRFPELNKVKFVVNGDDGKPELVKEGFLPEGVDLEFFFGSDRYKGYKILSWKLENGTAYETMPDTDIVVYADIEPLLVSAESDVTAVYDEAKSYTLTTSVIYTYVNPQYKYQWYKYNGDTPVKVDGATSSTYVVKNVLDSGKYYCEITVDDGDLHAVVNTNCVIVEISPQPKNINNLGITWDYTAPFTFAEGVTNKVLASESSPIIDFDYYLDNAKVNAGNYKAYAYFKIIDSNYCFEDSLNYVSCDWVVLQQELGDDLTFTWSYTDETKFVYAPGKVHRVTLTAPQNLMVKEYRNETANQAGEYTAVAVITSSNPNYVWVGTDKSCDWTVEKAVLDLSKLEWAYTEELTYSGEEQSVLLKNAPVDLVWLYTDNVKTNAGKYTANVEPDPNSATNNANYVFTGAVPACEWTIAKAKLETAVVGAWNYKDAFTYDGTTRKVDFVVSEGLINGVELSVEGNTASDVGTYKAVATLKAIDADNFVVTGETVKFELDWAINKAKVDMSTIKFPNKTVSYDGNAHSIEIVGTLPSGVSVEYSAPKTDVGEYEMTATFVYNEANYEPIPALTAILKIVPTYEQKNYYSYADTDGNVIAEIKAENGITSDHELNVNDVTTSYADFDFGNFFGPGKNGKIYTAYDIHFAVDGGESAVEDIFTVKLALPANFNGDVNNLRVVYIAENGELTDMEAILDGNNVAFRTYHFSVYAIVEIVDRVEVPATQDLSWLITLLIIIAVLALAILIVLVLILKKLKKSPEEPENNENEPEPTEPEPEAEEAPAEETPAEEAPAEEAPAEEAPVEETPVEEAPVEETPAEEAPAEEAPAEEAPAEETPAEEAPAEEAPVEEAPAEEAPVEEAPAEEAPVEEALAEEAPAEEAPVEEAPAEEAPVEEALAEEAPAEEAPAEEAPAEEAPVEEAPIVYDTVDEAVEKHETPIIPTDLVAVRYRSSFMSRLIQSEPPIQDYYTVLKNALLSYKGVKARMSWNFESFNKGRIQCAKLNVKGRNFLVYLGLKLEDYNVNKYHFTDASDKPTFESVPMLIKVKSDRSLKYALELIDEVMRINGLERTTIQEVDYHMPYESTPALVQKDLVKAILPPGVKFDSNWNFVKADVGAIIDEANEKDNK